jgi:hypothetical protein
MVKISVDCPKEAPRCQRILSTPPQISFDPDQIMDAGGRFFSGAACCDKKLLALPLADPGAPPVISKWEKSTPRHQRINLRADGRCLSRPKVIVYHEPATVSQQVAVAIQVPPHIIVGIEDKQANFAIA